MLKWEIDSFTPSDGSKVGGTKIDHLAWLKGSKSDGPPYVHVSLNIASTTTTEEQARAMLEAMVMGLSQADEIAKLREAIEDAIETLEAMDLHIDNPLYERLRATVTGEQR